MGPTAGPRAERSSGCAPTCQVAVDARQIPERCRHVAQSELGTRDVTPGFERLLAQGRGLDCGRVGGAGEQAPEQFHVEHPA